jgi:hypothetical protein
MIRDAVIKHASEPNLDAYLYPSPGCGFEGAGWRVNMMKNKERLDITDF